MLVPGRYSTANDYRYGFQGQEKDNEIKGEGNSLNYTFRMHDPRIGRFFAVDPLFREYVYNSPYAFSENKVIQFVELEGREIDIPKMQKINHGKLEDDPEREVSGFILNSVISVVNGLTGLVNYSSELVVGDKDENFGAQKVLVDIKKAVSNAHGYVANNTPQQVKKDAKKIFSKADIYEDIFGAIVSAKGLNQISKIGTLAKVETAAIATQETISVTKKAASLFTNIEKVSSIAAKNCIKSMQRGLRNENVVSEILSEMKSTAGFDVSKHTIGGYLDKGIYYINEGNHRMAAAIQYQIETGSSKYIDELLKSGSWTKKTPEAKTYDFKVTTD